VFRNKDGGYLEMFREGVVNKYVESRFCRGFKFELTMWNVPWTVELF
jgi:hypothetical protein